MITGAIWHHLPLQWYAVHAVSRGGKVQQARNNSSAAGALSPAVSVKVLRAVAHGHSRYFPHTWPP